jgi:uncharacterized membrane protein YbhN (UPF0104 family)
LPILGLVLFGYILHNLDIGRALTLVLHADPVLFSLGMAMVVLLLPIKAVRHYFILKNQGISIAFTPAATIFFKSAFWGFLSPGRLGEFSKVIYLDGYSASKRKSAASVLIDRVLDLTCLFVLLPISALLADAPGRDTVVLLSCLALMAGGGAMVAMRQAFKTRRSGILALLGDVTEELWQLKNKAFLLLFTLLGWLFYYAGMHIAALSIGVNAGAAFIVFCATSSNLMAVVPVSVAGIGTRDALLIYLFRTASFSDEQAVVFSAFFVAAIAIQAAMSYVFVLGDRKER